MRARRLVSIVGAAFCCGALVTTAVLRVPDAGPSSEVEAGVRGTEAPAEVGDTAAPESPGLATPTEASREPARPEPEGPSPSGDGAASSADVPPWPTGATSPLGTSGVSRDEDALEPLRERDLLLPVEGVTPDALTNTFEQARGERRHEALDILAPRRTPVRAVEGGRIVKLFESERGGLTVYQFDPQERYCYYYAHLDAYARGLSEGQSVARGDLIGYVGTTGNAPADTPHLHFAVFVLGPERRWWEGRAINPYPLFRD